MKRKSQVREEDILSKKVSQVVNYLGDGKLRDGNETSVRFRSFLANQVPDSNHLAKYLDECLRTTFDGSGLVLQDVVNEIGKRLGFEVQHGRYRGTTKELGWDGIWKAQERSFVIEVKTTTTYPINLGTLTKYKNELIEKKIIDQNKSSILIVAGRDDTGNIEEQIRGSRNAWDTRIISCEALLDLLRVKETLSGVRETLLKIQKVLQPLEYTRLDGIVAMLFNTSEEIRARDFEEDDAKEGGAGAQTKRRPVSYYQECVERIQKKLHLPLVKEGRCAYANEEKGVRILCIVSKAYGDSGFWFAFHPTQREYLAQAKNSFVALGCGSANDILFIPSKKFEEYLEKMDKTVREDRYYWHVRVWKKDGHFFLYYSPPKGMNVTEYILQ